MQTGFDEFAFGVFESPLKIGNDAFEPRAGPVVAALVGAVHQNLLDFLGNVLERQRNRRFQNRGRTARSTRL